MAALYDLYDHETLPSDWTWLDHSGHGWKLKKKSFLQILDSNQLGCVYSVSRNGSIAVVLYHAIPCQGGAETSTLGSTGSRRPGGLSQLDQKLMASHATLGVIAYMQSFQADFWKCMVSSNDYIPTSLPVLHQIFENFVCVSYCIILCTVSV